MDFTGLTDGGVIGQSPEGVAANASANIFDEYATFLEASHNGDPLSVDHLQHYDAQDTPTLLGYIHYIGEGQSDDVVQTHGDEFVQKRSLFRNAAMQEFDQQTGSTYYAYSSNGTATSFGYIQYTMDVEQAARISADAELKAIIGLTGQLFQADAQLIGNRSFDYNIDYVQKVENAGVKEPADLEMYGGTGDSLHNLMGMIAFAADGMILGAGDFAGDSWNDGASDFGANTETAFAQGGTF